MNPKVTLISWTKNPIETVYAVWQQSKSNDAIISPKDIDPTDPKVLKVFEGVINSHIPVSDFLNFVFVLEDISISFREQMVRHKIGMKFGAQMSVDIIPEQSDSSFWGQSMRILDMSKFYDEGRYRLPEILEGKLAASTVYHTAMQVIQESYKELLKLGIPMEDAREVIPLGATHRFAWSLNLTALKHVIGKRSCWIPQMGLWEPIITGMIEELCKIHPIFRNLVKPPCIGSDGKFKDCVYKIDNERRISREDETLPCPLYLYHHKDKNVADNVPENKIQKFNERTGQYGKLWGHNPVTWDNHHTINWPEPEEKPDMGMEGL